ncbi:MAG: HAD hydrolase family protein, partial [Ruminococcus sp.]|nr:HAD hydrolase family protein [Ruminococcus sp.]
NNDIEMLEAADVGICPANAVPEVKAAANVCLKQSCEEDAIAAAVEFIFDQINSSQG